MLTNKKARLGEILVSENVVTAEQIEKALSNQGRKKKRLGKVLIDMGLTTEEDIAGAVSRQLGMPFMDLGGVDPTPEAAGLLEKSFLSDNLIIPLEINDGVLTIAVSDPNNLMALDEAAYQTGLKISPVISTETGVLKCIERAFRINERIEEMLRVFKIREDMCFLALPQDKESDVQRRFHIDDSSQAVRMLAFIITDAFNKKASDILIDPLSDRLRLRYRILGDLVDIISLPNLIKNSLVSHLKILSNLDLANNKTPQTGKSKMSLSNRSVLLEVSTVPSQMGERVTIRLYDKERPALSFKEMGLSLDTAGKLLELASDGHGIVVFAGPGGSGKITAMYAMLREVISGRLDIVTIQEHSSYKLDRATQIELGELNTSRALSYSMLNRPDIIMIERIEDSATARLALKAAAAGSLVLAGVVASGPDEALSRLYALGADPLELAAALSGVAGVRLIRTICPQCAEKYSPDTGPFSKLGLAMPDAFQRGKGCKACSKTGYKGHVPVVEIAGTKGVDASLIGRSQSRNELRDIFSGIIQKPMFMSVWDMVAAGKTTIEELVGKVPPAYWTTGHAMAVKTAPAPATPSTDRAVEPPAVSAVTMMTTPAASASSPGRADATAAPVSAPSPGSEFRDVMRQHKILLAVTDKSDQNRIKDRLAESDMEPLIASDGKHALDLMYSENPDLLICDVRLPGMEDLTKYKKLYDKQRRHVPVIMIFRGSAEGFTNLDSELDVDVKLLRPLDLPKLMDNVGQLLSRQSGRIQ